MLRLARDPLVLAGIALVAIVLLAANQLRAAAKGHDDNRAGACLLVSTMNEILLIGEQSLLDRTSDPAEIKAVTDRYGQFFARTGEASDTLGCPT